ncbi:hypothetical protein QCD83_12525 [Pseudomonas savastanoi pv. phaseolicola]|nr:MULTISPECIES: hypothetical protein [Pseudomonas]KPB37267.1 Uncharacterized protein AC514_1120 [Pseudomonas savastanoi pv. phaseolicola]KPB38859.1 Uncharacterized protein AC513_3319 [Pseudomonas savastanoi pv. phaseolicola]KPB57630.1 Uncharacterized protein AC508_4038 [Pseudomonas amygdali pv. mellea]KPB67043.1 Uncharacterized protein AC512_1013 [Pseudomonas savastanoi pv. phaseolicola]MBN4180119.1 hypothetical protein [Pseudomonas savastanoi pv. phaseolicola]
MSQISIPHVAYFPLEIQPPKIDPHVLSGALRIPPELYVDAEHHGAVYCPDCGVMCSRMPRLLAKRKDNVDAFFFHMPGYDDVPCPHRKSAAGGGDDGAGKERKAVNLVTFAGWKSLDDDELPEDEDEIEKSSKSKSVVQRGSARGGSGFELVYNENGTLLNAGEFRTVKRLVYLAQKSLEISVQFEGEDAIKLRDLIVPIERIQKNPSRYIGKSFLLFGQPITIKVGTHRVFFNFPSSDHSLSGHCAPAIFEKRQWKTFERGHYYIFYGVIEGTETKTSVRILEPGQIDRLPSSAHDLFRSLR